MSASTAYNYADPRDDITQPHHHVQLTHYYVDNWLPVLGERGHVIVTVLRRMAYLDRKKGVIRDGVEIEQDALASLCGLTLRTFQREFSSAADGTPLNPALHQFVQREKQYHRNTAGRITREKTVYVVAMHDPVMEKDLPLLQNILESRDKNQSRQLGGNGTPEPSARSRQYGGDSRQNGGDARQLGTPARQLGGNLKTPDSLRKENTLEDAADAAPEISASLFEQKEPDKKEPAERTWAMLTAGEQQPHLDQARHELVLIHVGSGITPKPKLIEVRAKNLYQAQMQREIEAEEARESLGVRK